jgi:cellulose synthase/poly-beta-1,6-N-acetylglucosamine synthase-like glycosyltransferase
MVGSAITYSLLFISLYFEIFLLVSFLERRFERRAPRGNAASLALPASYPLVAIVVPCFNEEKTVASTLTSLLALDYPKDKLEIIVVDDGSRDSTLSIARQFESDSRIQVFHKENGGKHTAMNYALERTRADLIGCLDADSVVAPEALLSVIAVFENEKVAAVTPGIHVKNPTNMLQHMQKVEYRLSIFNRFMLAALGSAFITPGPFSIFRTSTVRDLGGWRHGHSTEDMEMALRMQAAGFLIGNAPKAVVHTGTPRTIRHLFRQRVRWTYGFLRNAADYRRMVGSRTYGNLGIIVLPTALISIGAGIYFFARTVYYFGISLGQEFTKVRVTGALPHPAFDLFYVNTSTMWFLIFAAVALILVLISAGSFIGTGSRKPPIGTPLFVLFYSFLVPLWLGTAVVRAVFKTGVRWR